MVVASDGLTGKLQAISKYLEHFVSINLRRSRDTKERFSQFSSPDFILSHKVLLVEVWGRNFGPQNTHVATKTENNKTFL